MTSLDPMLDGDYITTNSSLISASVATENYAQGLALGYLGGSYSSTTIEPEPETPTETETTTPASITTRGLATRRYYGNRTTN